MHVRKAITCMFERKSKQMYVLPKRKQVYACPKHKQVYIVHMSEKCMYEQKPFQFLTVKRQCYFIQ